MITCLLSLYFTGCSSNSGQYRVENLQTIPLELSTHLVAQQNFVEGEEIQFLLSIGSDAYVYMFHINADGYLTKILPHKQQNSHHYLAGYFLTIPEYKNQYRFIVSKPYGVEAIWIVASDQSIEINNLNTSIKHIKKTIKQASKKAYGEYHLNITTAKK